MSKLDDILNDYDHDLEQKEFMKQQIKDLILEIIDDTVMGLGGDVPYGELSRKIEKL